MASSLGSREASMENTSLTGVSLHFRGGTLQYTGTTPQSTNREIRILNGATGGTIDASGATPDATLSFTHSGTNINLFDTAGARTLTLTGSNTGNNSFSIRLTDQATNATSLRKAGSGTWVLTNSDNTYTGETIIAGGILNVASVSDYGVPSSIGSRTLAQENQPLRV
jgi:fibronectin-binding autotransporter adhesin